MGSAGVPQGGKTDGTVPEGVFRVSVDLIQGTGQGTFTKAEITAFVYLGSLGSLVSI